MAKGNCMVLRTADRSTAHGRLGTVGSTLAGRKPRELAKVAAKGVATQGVRGKRRK